MSISALLSVKSSISIPQNQKIFARSGVVVGVFDAFQSKVRLGLNSAVAGIGQIDAFAALPGGIQRQQIAGCSDFMFLHC